jgi:hypothetical protein
MTVIQFPGSTYTEISTTSNEYEFSTDGTIQYAEIPGCSSEVGGYYGYYSLTMVPEENPADCYQPTTIYFVGTFP